MHPGRRCHLVVPCVFGPPLKPHRLITPWKPRSILKHAHTTFINGRFHGLLDSPVDTHIRITAFCPGPPGWASTRKVKPIWILQKQETVSGSGISWAICKSAPRSRQITMPAPHHSVFLQARCPSCHPTNSVKALKAVGSSVMPTISQEHFSSIVMNATKSENEA